MQYQARSLRSLTKYFRQQNYGSNQVDHEEIRAKIVLRQENMHRHLPKKYDEYQDRYVEEERVAAAGEARHIFKGPSETSEPKELGGLA